MAGSMDAPSALLRVTMCLSARKQVVMTGMMRRQFITFLSIVKVQYLHYKKFRSYLNFQYQSTSQVPTIIQPSYLLYIINQTIMFPGMFWVKYLFRVLHIGSLVTVCQAIINAKMTGQISEQYGVLYMVAGITVIVSGFVNIFLLNAKDMGEKRKHWVAYQHLKALTAAVIFTPLIKVFPIAVQTRIDVQFYWMVLALLLSPFARFYREHFVAKENRRREKQVRDDDSL